MNKSKCYRLLKLSFSSAQFVFDLATSMSSCYSVNFDFVFGENMLKTLSHKRMKEQMESVGSFAGQK